jgi:hypothetical protein
MELSEKQMQLVFSSRFVGGGSGMSKSAVTDVYTTLFTPVTRYWEKMFWSKSSVISAVEKLSIS